MIMEGDDLVESIKRRIEAVHCNHWRQGRPTIFRVPTNLRWWDKKTYNEESIFNGPYDPKYVSIGPYHRRNPRLHNMEEFKVRMLQVLLQGNQAGTNLERCVEVMEGMEVQARSCYSEAINMNKKEFVEMMLLDGCFIVFILAREISEDVWEFLEDAFWNPPKPLGDGGPIAPSNFLWGKVKLDLVLLENQIPFFVVKALFELFFPQFGSMLNWLAVRALRGLNPGETILQCKVPQNQVHHLLHLFYLSRLPDRDAVQAISSPMTNTPKWIPSVTELKEAGVKFKANKEKNFLDVTFHDGVLEIPVVGLYDRTEPILRNLIAFEQCFKDTNYLVTYYTLFMECLLHSSQDVLILQKKEIVINWVSDEVEAARLFNQLGIEVYCDVKDNYLWRLFTEVNGFCSKKREKWWAIFRHNHLSNPWTISKLVGAILLLLFAFFQTFFTMYSYFHPPPK